MSLELISDIENYKKLNISKINNISNFFTNYYYLKLLQEYLSADFKCIVLKDKDSIIAAIPFFIKSGPLGNIVNSLPFFGSNGGMMYNSCSIINKDKIMNFFLNIMHDFQVVSYTIISSPFYKDDEFYNKYNFDNIIERVAFITQFKNQNIDEIYNKISSSAKRNIKKANSLNIEISISKDKKIKNFLMNNHISSIQNKNGDYKDIVFFNKLFETLPNRYWDIFYAHKNDEIMSALLVLYGSKVVEYFIPVIKEEYKSNQSLSLIIYEAFKHAVKNNNHYFNWGGTWLSQEGVIKFKSKWSDIRSSYFYYNNIINSNIYDHNSLYFRNNYKHFYVVPFEKLKQ